MRWPTTELDVIVPDLMAEEAAAAEPTEEDARTATVAAAVDASRMVMLFFVLL